MVFWGGLGVFQSNHLHSSGNEKVSTPMIYAGLCK
jgi:hypothetical protein